MCVQGTGCGTRSGPGTLSGLDTGHRFARAWAGCRRAGCWKTIRYGQRNSRCGCGGVLSRDRRRLGTARDSTSEPVARIGDVVCWPSPLRHSVDCCDSRLHCLGQLAFAAFDCPSVCCSDFLLPAGDNGSLATISGTFTRLIQTTRSSGVGAVVRWLRTIARSVDAVGPVGPLLSRVWVGSTYTGMPADVRSAKANSESLRK